LELAITESTAFRGEKKLISTEANYSCTQTAAYEKAISWHCMLSTLDFFHLYSCTPAMAVHL
jgi:hypothetical protein